MSSEWTTPFQLRADLWASVLWRASWQGGLFVLIVAVACRFLPKLPAAARCRLWWLACLKLLAGVICVTPIALPVLPALRAEGDRRPHTAALSSAHRPVARATSLAGAGVPTSAVPTPTIDPIARSDAAARATPQAGIPDRTPHESAESRAESTAGAAEQPPNSTPRPGLARPVSDAANESGAPTRSWRTDTAVLLLGAWLVGIAAGLRRAVRQWRAVRRLLREARPVTEPEVLEEVRTLAAVMGLRRAPALVEAPAALGPLVTGLWRPAVVLPANAAEPLSPGELRMALAHELAHVRRRDLAWGVVPDLARLLFFFHPLVWLACREWATAREAACDAEALRATGAPTAAYGRLLLKLAAAGSRGSAAPALGATAGFYALQGRIRLLRQFAPRPSRPVKRATMLAVALAALFLPPWRLTTAATPHRSPATRRDALPPSAASPAATPGISAAAASRDAAAACARQLQAIGRALAAYQRDHGDLPPHLSDLVPRYLPDRRMLHCPADRSPGKVGLQWVPADPRLPVSYFYHTSMDRGNPNGYLFGPPEATPGKTRRQILAAQAVYFGERVPVVRCLHHPKVLHLTLAGQVYRGSVFWEYDWETVPVLLRCMERDLDAGPATFLRRWQPDRIAEHLSHFAGVPSVPSGLPARFRAAASQVTARLPAFPEASRGDLLGLAGILSLAAGDRSRAIAALEAALRAQNGRGFMDYLLPERLLTLYAQTGQQEKRIAFLEKWLAQNPTDVFRIQQLAQAYEDAGQHDRAASCLARAVPFLEAMLARQPWSTRLMAQLADAYEAAGQREKAAELRRKADPGALLVGRPAPDFTLRDLDGNVVRLADLRGKVVFLNFWGFT